MGVMRMHLGIVAVLVFGCTTDYASSDAGGEGSQGSDASPNDGGHEGRLARAETERASPSVPSESDHAAERAPADDVVRANADRAEAAGVSVAAATEVSVAATAGAVTGATAPSLDGTSRCGERAVCVEPRRDPIEACRAALPALVAANMLYEPTGCTLVPASTTRAGSGAIRGVALVSVDHMEIGTPIFVVLEGEHGYDRLVYLLDIDAGINQGTEYAIDAVAIEDLLTGGSLEARVELSRTISDSACTEPLLWDTTRRDVAVCGIDAAGQTYCTPPIPRTFVEIESTYDDETDENTPTRRTRFALAVAFDRGEIVVRRTSGRVPRLYRPLLGRHSPAAWPHISLY